MDVIFAAQPWADGSNLDDFLDAVATDAAAGPVRLRVVVAWAKRSGVTRATPYFTGIQATGGSVEMIVGISEGGATKQGLELAMKASNRVDVFHDPGRTFHPKVYLSQGEASVRLFVGSNNLTRGGLAHNHEAGLAVHLGASGSVDAPGLVTTVEQWIARLQSEATSCVELTPESFAVMLADPRYRIGDEDKAPSSVDKDGEVQDTDSVTDEASPLADRLFAPSTTAKKGARHNATGSKVGHASSPKDLPSAPSGDDEPDLPEPTGTKLLRWSKLLKSADAQQVASGTSPTGALRLSQSGHAIDKETFFRESFFGDLVWADDPVKVDLQFTEVPVDVTVLGQHLGSMTFRVDHKAARASDQGNVTTVLKWGPMNAIMRKDDYIGDWVLLEKLTDGFRLEIVGDDPSTA